MNETNTIVNTKLEYSKFCDRFYRSNHTLFVIPKVVIPEPNSRITIKSIINIKRRENMVLVCLRVVIIDNIYNANDWNTKDLKFDLIFYIYAQNKG